MADRENLRTQLDLVRLLLGHLPRFRTARLQDVATRALQADGGDGGIVSVLNATLQLRQQLQDVVALRPRRALSRLRFALDGRGLGPCPPRALSLLCPTRNRVGNVMSFLDSLCRTAAAGGRVEVLFYVDSDDPDLPAYQALIKRARYLYGEIGRCVLHIGPAVGVPQSWNALAAAASGDLLLMANDDQVYVDYGWDAALDRRVTELTRLCPDNVLCLYFDAGQYPEGGPDFPIVTRTWFETLGYFTPTIFQQWEVERWIFDIAHRVGRLFPVPGVFVEHRHYQDYKAPFDATYQRHRMTREKSLSDHALFLRTVGDRARQAAVLQAVMDGEGARPPGAPAPDPPAAVVPPSPATAHSPADFWFTARLSAEHSKMVAEVDRMLLLGAAGTGSRGAERLALFEHGSWTSTAYRSFPVITSIMADIPEATVHPGAAVDVVVLHAGGQAAPRCEPDQGRLQVVVGLRTPPGARLQVGGRDQPWEPPGRCLIVDGGQPVEFGNDSQEALVALAFAVPRAEQASGPPRTLTVTAMPAQG